MGTLVTRRTVAVLAALPLAAIGLSSTAVAHGAPSAPLGASSSADGRAQLERDRLHPSAGTHRTDASSIYRTYSLAPRSTARRAASATGSDVTTFPVPYCCPEQEVAAAGALVVLDNDGEHGHVRRLDPGTGKLLTELYLPVTPSGDAPNGQFNDDTPKMVVARGSVWFASYFENLVYRLDPVTLAVQARIRTGRTPTSLTFDGHALWTTLNNSRSIARIDPRRNRVVQRVRLGHQRDLTDEPYSVLWSGTELLVTLPGSGRVAHLTARGRILGYDQVGAHLSSPSINKLVLVPGGYWIDATDDGTGYFRWSYRSRSITASFTTPYSVGMAYANGAVYTGGAQCDANVTCTGLIEKHDPTTGALLDQRGIPGTTSIKPFVVFGSLWTVDFFAPSLQRSPLF